MLSPLVRMNNGHNLNNADSGDGEKSMIAHEQHLPASHAMTAAASPPSQYSIANLLRLNAAAPSSGSAHQLHPMLAALMVQQQLMQRMQQQMQTDQQQRGEGWSSTFLHNISALIQTRPHRRRPASHPRYTWLTTAITARVDRRPTTSTKWC